MRHCSLFILLCAWILWEQTLPQEAPERSQWRVEYAFESIDQCEKYLGRAAENWAKGSTASGYLSEFGADWRTLWKLGVGGEKSELIQTVRLRCLPDTVKPQPGQ
jgi:hypothetical protein